MHLKTQIVSTLACTNNLYFEQNKKDKNVELKIFIFYNFKNTVYCSLRFYYDTGQHFSTHVLHMLTTELHVQHLDHS